MYRMNITEGFSIAAACFTGGDSEQGFSLMSSLTGAGRANSSRSSSGSTEVSSEASAAAVGAAGAAEAVGGNGWTLDCVDGWCLSFRFNWVTIRWASQSCSSRCLTTDPTLISLWIWASRDSCFFNSTAIASNSSGKLTPKPDSGGMYLQNRNFFNSSTSFQI